MITNPAETMQVERFSFFASVNNSKEAIGEGTIEQLHQKIVSNSAWAEKIEMLRRIETEAEQKKFKKNAIPAITASVWIKNGMRQELRDGNFTHTNLIQADLDDCPNPAAVLEKLKNDPHARLIFRSPRGRVKALMKVKPVETIHDHNSAWEAVNAYCKERGYGKMDPVPKAINSLCIISHDPEAILKDAISLHWEPLPKATYPSPAKRRFTSDSNLQSALDAIPPDDYEVWAEVGMALYHDGRSFDMWDAWSQKSEKYHQTPAEMRSKWESFATDREDKHRRGYIFYLAEQYGWQPSPPSLLDPDAERNDARSYYNRGAAYHKNGDYDNAVADYTQAIELNLDGAYYAYLGRADACYDKGDYDNAIADYTQAIKLNPNYANTYCKRGVSYHAKGDYDNTIADCTQAIHLNPDFATAYFGRGWAYYAKGYYDNAITNYTQAIHLKPDYADAYYNRGEAYSDIEDYDNAIADYTQAIKLNPDFVDAYYNRGQAYYAIEDYDNAIADYTQAIELNPDFADAYFDRAYTYHDKEDYDNVIADLTQAIKLKPDYADAYFGRGWAYYAIEDYGNAIADYTQAIKLNPDFAEAYSWLAQAYYWRGEAYLRGFDYDNAIKNFTQAIKLNPDFADAYYNRGLNYFAKGNYDCAISDLTQVIRLEPNHAKARDLRSQVYQRKDDYKRAIVDSDKAAARRSSS